MREKHWEFVLEAVKTKIVDSENDEYREIGLLALRSLEQLRALQALFASKLDALWLFQGLDSDDSPRDETP